MCVVVTREGSLREEKERSSKQIITPSHDYLRLPLWPLVPITWIRQPHTHTYFSFIWSKIHDTHWHTDNLYSLPAIRGHTFSFPLFPPPLWGCAHTSASMTRYPLLIASSIADGHRKKTYSKLGKCREVSALISSILPILLRVSELPLELQTQALFPFVLPSATSLLTFPFPTHPPPPDSYRFSSSSCFFFFPPPHSFLSNALEKRSGGGGDADLWLEPHFLAFCSRKVRSHGIAISPARLYRCRQLQAAAGSLIRVCVMSPHSTCCKHHTALKQRQTGHGLRPCQRGSHIPPQQKKNLPSLQSLRSDQFWPLCWVLFCVCDKYLW